MLCQPLHEMVRNYKPIKILHWTHEQDEAYAKVVAAVNECPNFSLLMIRYPLYWIRMHHSLVLELTYTKDQRRGSYILLRLLVRHSPENKRDGVLPKKKLMQYSMP